MWLAIFHIIVFMSLLYPLNKILNLPTVNNGDISGWYSLLVGSTIGIYITFAILIYSDTSQQKVSDIIEQQEKFNTKKRNRAYTGLNGNMCALRFSVRNLEREYELFQEGQLTDEEYIEQIQKFVPYVQGSLENLQNYCDSYEQYVGEEILSDIDKLLIDGRLYCEMGLRSREFFDPTSDFLESFNQTWQKIPDPFDGYSKLKKIYGVNGSNSTSTNVE